MVFVKSQIACNLVGLRCNSSPRLFRAVGNEIDLENESLWFGFCCRLICCRLSFRFVFRNNQFIAISFIVLFQTFVYMTIKRVFFADEFVTKEYI